MPFSRFARIPIEHPFAFGVTLSTFKTSLSDLIVQKGIEGRDEIDWPRNFTFASFGCFYLGCFQYGLYVKGFTRLFPNAESFAKKSIREKLKDKKGLLCLFKQVFLDQGIHHPLIYFPTFYMTREFVTADKPDYGKSLSLYRNNIQEDLTALWKIWVPATIINFAFMPMWARIPWVAGTSLLWTSVLSAMRGGNVSDAKDMIGAPITGATMTLMTESMKEYFTCPVELDRNLSHFSLSATGLDKIGLVALLARTIADNGGSVTNSKMLRMGTECSVMMHISVEPENILSLMNVVTRSRDLESLNVRTGAISRRLTKDYSKPVVGLKLHCIGPDRPGMLAMLTERIALRELSIENIDTNLRVGSNGEKQFVINVECTSSEDMEDRNAWLEEFKLWKKELNVGILDVSIYKL